MNFGCNAGRKKLQTIKKSKFCKNAKKTKKNERKKPKMSKINFIFDDS